MTDWQWGAAGVGVVGVGGAAVLGRLTAKRGVHRWLLPYLLSPRRRRAPRQGEPVHLLLCVADHYEPKLGNAYVMLNIPDLIREGTVQYGIHWKVPNLTQTN